MMTTRKTTHTHLHSLRLAMTMKSVNEYAHWINSKFCERQQQNTKKQHQILRTDSKSASIFADNRMANRENRRGCWVYSCTTLTRTQTNGTLCFIYTDTRHDDRCMSVYIAYCAYLLRLSIHRGKCFYQCIVIFSI